MATDTANDPVRRGQLLLRRAGEALRDSGALPRPSFRHETLEGEALERFFATGAEQISRLAPEIERLLERPLQSARALDYGCGMGRSALPLAEWCEHVYGLDISDSALLEAAAHAERSGRHNVEWLQAERLPELAGAYDIVFSMWVFQHIPSREGERILTELIRGMRPGGVGVIHLTLRFAFNPLDLRHLVKNGYLMMNSYSLNRVGDLLAHENVTDWQAKWHARDAEPSVTLTFRRA